MKIWIKTPDIIIILAVAGLTFYAAFIAYMKPQEKSMVLIRGQDREWVYPIETEAAVVITGPLGDTTVQIRGNSAWIETSPCDNHTCIAAGSISKQGEWTACLPNNVLVIVHGIGDDIDGLSW